jgi:nucleoside 2-deoxyribosyltransferase
MSEGSQMADKKIKIYIAGPDVFVRNPKEHGEQLKAVVAMYGIKGVFPMDPVITDLKNGDPESGYRIYKSDLQLVTECDAVVANMSPFRGPSMDTGTVFEMGLAVGQGKPVFGYSEDLSDYSQKVLRYTDLSLKRRDDGTIEDSEGNMVESFGMSDNLMMIGAVMDTIKNGPGGPNESEGWLHAMHGSFEAAVATAQYYFHLKGMIDFVGRKG